MNQLKNLYRLPDCLQSQRLLALYHSRPIINKRTNEKILLTDEGSLRQSGTVGRKAPGPKQDRKGLRRKRTAFTVRQLERMQSVFQWNKYPGVTIREALAAELGISEACVQVRPCYSNI